MSDREIKVDESYTTFKNIDCFENACCMVDHLLRIIKDEQFNNEYWEKFVSKIPQAYYERNAELDPSESLLYLVCSSIFNIVELFEDADDEDALHALAKCEQECC